MELYVIPVEDRFILYRPLLRRAFVGNRAMADLVVAATAPTPQPVRGGEALAFLQEIGFLQPDPAPPPEPRLDRYAPSMAVLLLTNRCNLRCIYCYADGGAGPVYQDMPVETATAAIDYVYENAKAQGRPSFDLTFHGGGEPMQAWDLMRDAVAYARAKDLPCRTSMVSNGVWSASQRAWVLENLDGVSISFDGRPETQDRQRPMACPSPASAAGPSSATAALHTLAALDAAKLPYGIRMTAIAPWRDTLPEDVRFICEHTSCQVIQVEPAFNIERGTHRASTAGEGQAFAEGFVAAFEIAGRAGRRLTYSGARPWLLTRTFCSAPYNALIVTPSGDLVTCYEIADGDHELAGMSTIGQIADGQIALDLAARRALLERLEAKKATCDGCFLKWHCAGDCYTRTFDAERGGFLSPSPRCETNRQIATQLLLWYIRAGDGVWRGQPILPQDAALFDVF